LFFLVPVTATTDTHTLSLHDALPIWLPGLRPGRRPVPGRKGQGRRPEQSRAVRGRPGASRRHRGGRRGGDRRGPRGRGGGGAGGDRKSTRLNSSHVAISYAVFCLKKK